jgi:hypothetical protein
MQALSNMRRNSSDYQHIKDVAFVVALGFYLILGNINVFLSPLVGVFFTYLLLYLNKEYKSVKDNINIYLIFLYLIFFELSRGFYLFSAVVVFFIVLYFLKKRIISIFKSENWIFTIFVISAYIGTYLINNLFCYLQEKELFSFNFMYVFYILIDSIVSILLFKKR